MTKLLLSIHVLAAIIAIGPVTVAASMFPAAARRAGAEPADQRGVAVLRNLHRICRVYAALGVLVPVFGLATASSLGVLGDAWLIVSMVLTVTAAAVLGLLVLPRQAAILHAAAGHPAQAGTPLPDHPAQPGTTAPDHPARSGTIAPGHPTQPGTTAPGHPAQPGTIAPGHPAQLGTTAPEHRPAGAVAVRVDGPGSPDGAILDGRANARLGMVTGIFNLLWAVVVVLMIVRPGSTTGA